MEATPADEEDTVRKLKVSQYPTAFFGRQNIRARFVVCGGSEHRAGFTHQAPLLRRETRRRSPANQRQYEPTSGTLSEIVIVRDLVHRFPDVHPPRAFISPACCFVFHHGCHVPPNLTDGQEGKGFHPSASLAWSR